MAEHYFSIAARAAPLNKFANFRESVAMFRSARSQWMGYLADRSLFFAKKALAQGYADENVYKTAASIRRKEAYKAIDALARRL